MRLDLDDLVDLKLPQLKRRERPYESRLRDELKKQRILFVKCKPTVVGFPDRLAIGNARMRLCEIKREGGKLSDVQIARHAELKRHGIDVLVIEGPSVPNGVRAVRKALGLR